MKVTSDLREGAITRSRSVPLGIQFRTTLSPVAQPGDEASADQSSVSQPDGKIRHFMTAYGRQRPNVGERFAERSGSHRRSRLPQPPGHATKHTSHGPKREYGLALGVLDGSNASQRSYRLVSLVCPA